LLYLLFKKAFCFAITKASHTELQPSLAIIFSYLLITLNTHPPQPLLIHGHHLFIKLLLNLLYLNKILLLLVPNILLMCLYFSFYLLLMLQNNLLDLFGYFVIPRLLVDFLLLVVVCDELFQFLQSILFVNNLSPQQRNLILLLLHILLLFCHLHITLHLIPFSHPTLLILHLPLQRYLLPQYLILHLQYIILRLFYQLIPLLYLTFLNIKHLVD